MTVQTSTRRHVVSVAAGASASSAAVPFQFQRGQDLVVTVTPALGAPSTLSFPGGYTTTGGDVPTGGLINFATPVVGPATIEIVRRTPRTQGRRFEDNGRFPAEAVEAGLDQVIMALQEEAEEAARAVLVPAGEAGFALPALPDRALRMAAFDAAGRLVPAAGLASAPVSPAMSPVVAAGSLPAGRDALGIPRYFMPEHYGAVGDGVTDDRLALQAALDAAGVAGGGVVLFSRTYATSTTILGTFNRVRVEGFGAHTGLIGLGATTITLLQFQGSGPTGTAKSITAAAAKGDRIVQLNNVTGLAVGSLLQFNHTPTGTPSAAYIWHAYIKAIAVNTVTLSEPLPIALALADSLSISAISTLEQVGARNFRVRRGANTGADTSGVSLQYCRESYAGEIWCEDIPALGFSAYYGVDNVFGDFWLERCGNAGYSDWNIAGQTNVVTGKVVSHRATGFGPKPQQCTYGSFGPITSIDATGRGIKISHCLHNHFAALRAHGASFTGIGFTEGSCHNTIDYAEALRNGNEGLWFSDQGSCDNHIRGYRAFGNVGNHIGIFPSDQRNVIEGIDLGSDAQYWGGTNSIGKTRRPVHCVMDRNGTNLAALPSGGATRVPMLRAIRDDGGNFDAVNGRFVARHPGNYLIVARATLNAVATTNYFQVTIFLNGNNVGMWDGLGDTFDVAETQGVSAVLRLEDGDFVDLHVYHTSTGARDVSGLALGTNISVTQI